MVLSPIWSRSRVTSMISTACPPNSPRPSLLNSSASMPAASNSRRCCCESPSLGVSRRMRFSSRRRPCPASACRYCRMLACISSVLPLPVAIQNASLLSCGHASAASSNAAIWSASGLSALHTATCAFRSASSFLGSRKYLSRLDLAKEKRQVLEVLPDDRLLAAADPPLVQSLRVLDDVLVVLQQQLRRQPL